MDARKIVYTGIRHVMPLLLAYLYLDTLPQPAMSSYARSICNKMATQTTQLNLPLTASAEPLEQYVHPSETKRD
jgi:hypothetical protein